MGIRVRAGEVNRCLVIGHVEVDKFEAGAGGEQCLEQGGEHGVQFSTVSLSLHQECGRTTKSWQPHPGASNAQLQSRRACLVSPAFLAGFALNSITLHSGSSSGGLDRINVAQLKVWGQSRREACNVQRAACQPICPQDWCGNRELTVRPVVP